MQQKSNKFGRENIAQKLKQFCRYGQIVTIKRDLTDHRPNPFGKIADVCIDAGYLRRSAFETPTDNSNHNPFTKFTCVAVQSTA